MTAESVTQYNNEMLTGDGCFNSSKGAPNVPVQFDTDPSDVYAHIVAAARARLNARRQEEK